MRYSKGSLKPAEIRTEMQKVMQVDAAVYRTGESLGEGVRKIDAVAATMDQVNIVFYCLVCGLVWLCSTDKKNVNSFIHSSVYLYICNRLD